MKSNEIRELYLKYFEKNGHARVASSRLVPEDDPTLLFANAGMNQFKNLFLGLEKRPYTRATTSQKCVRAGGKHNDLENVGHTARHHTFFEMLGNFSFGDYFKKDAIHFAWEFITKELQLPKDRLYVSVFEKDDEAADIWHNQEGVPRDRIYRFGEKDNFWRMGDVGPCGPCSEIFYDLGPDVPGDPKENVMGGNGDRFIEFWNLVFMQYNEDGQGPAKPLPKPSVDTGMGLERLTTILQGEISNYHTDAFLDLIGVAENISKKSYQKKITSGPVEQTNVAFRVLADHARACAFLMADGVLPSNEGRGYVLRRIMRRALRFGRQLAADQSIYPFVVEAVIKKMSAAYPELEKQKNFILSNVRDEEERFLKTLDQGTILLLDEIKKAEGRGQKALSGEVAFRLYDTYGFPVDLTRLMVEERGLAVDEKSFEENMEQAKQKARGSWKGASISSDAAFLVTWTQKIHQASGTTKFTGYDHLKEQTQVIGLSDGKADVASLKKGASGLVILKSTPFYAESGGQVGDHGYLNWNGGQARVVDCTKQNDLHLHHVEIVDGELKNGANIEAAVESQERLNTALNHSATHLMHAALRKVLGDHVTQAGSMVSADRLRFDFTHNKPLTMDERFKIEELVNEQIGHDHDVGMKLMSHKDALKEGAMALFGEKYGDEVRVICMGEFSMELCGGTHVESLSQIRAFKILSETGVSSGVRRIEAITGGAAVHYLNTLAQESLEARAKAGVTVAWDQNALPTWIERTQEQIKTLEKEIQKLKTSKVDAGDLAESAFEVPTASGSIKVAFADLDVDDRKVLSEINDRLRDKLQSNAIVITIGQTENQSSAIILSVSKDLQSRIHAGQLLGQFLKEFGGKGGGRPDFAQGALPGKRDSKLWREKCESVIKTFSANK